MEILAAESALCRGHIGLCSLSVSLLQQKRVCDFFVTWCVCAQSLVVGSCWALCVVGRDLADVCSLYDRDENKCRQAHIGRSVAFYKSCASL